ncbi:glycosyltransferase family 9 protein [Paraburkholderia sp. WC7.3b]|uniref:Glycosyltransferase family 9 protein n=1 Tax=Paraburkholderia podalyriae TaxID=1938811 RepID=A0ABR7PHB3_9BURK|nr:glycosyltransferase family 9 protein [Paraburkholderia podalyriae]
MRRWRPTDWMFVDCTKELKSFDESATLVGNLDLVITVCTSVAHLSGAPGVPTRLLLDVNPRWVWMLGRDDSPWYPSMRIYRQQHHGALFKTDSQRKFGNNRTPNKKQTFD